MIIKVGNWEVDSTTLFRVEWRKPFPKIILHEKFETKVKWTLRVLTFVGVGTSVISLPPLYSLLLSIGLLLFEQFLERILFEYTVFIVQPFPDFEIDYEQWLTNGYLFPNSAYKDELLNHFGPVYMTKEYAIKLFTYLKSWNLDNADDNDNNICLSFVLENDNSYTTYLYANPDRKWLDTMFDEYIEKSKYEKYGKQQQSLVMQMIHWKNLELFDTSLFLKFINDQKTKGEYYFLPFYIDNGQPIPIEDLKICKYEYQLIKRDKLTKNDIEYHYK